MGKGGERRYWSKEKEIDRVGRGKGKVTTGRRGKGEREGNRERKG